MAQSILGADFITPEEITKARSSIFYTDERVAALVESLPSKEVLMWCKEKGYAVIPTPPQDCSTLDIREIQFAHFHSKTGGWYSDQKFAREDKTGFGWLAIKKTPVANSTSKNWTEQNKLLLALEKVPNAAEMSWFITTYLEVRGVRLLENIYVWTSSLGSNGRRVYVGHFNVDGLLVSHYWGAYRFDGIGLSSARKFK
ncbi:hypothetical protein IT398_01140 [Candidatus Nomurabacteria bacterium]|nr:hypothetical protein [Candidatus Nomurabacteria bacterium]